MHRLRTAPVLTVFCLATLGALVVYAWREPWLPARFLTLSRGSGTLSALALCAALSVTPCARILRACGRAPSQAKVAQLRRSLGILAALASVLHAALSWTLVLPRELKPLLTVPHLRAGALALAILLALLLTSFPRLVRLLRVRVWSELHVLAYAAALLVLQHVLLSPFAPRLMALSVALAVGVLALARLLPRD
jgi:DMSO/TMAO reductase YedYZ heme-binding membrane subunit